MVGLVVQEHNGGTLYYYCLILSVSLFYFISLLHTSLLVTCEQMKSLV